MTDSVTSMAATPEPTLGSSPPAPPPTTPAPPPQPAAASAADLRLVIEDDRQAGCFVYKTINWTTGAVVQQLPREQVVKLREAANYVAGGVIDSKA